jgi:hypothetical protein
MNVFARMRSNGLSHVRPSACIEFMFNLLRFKFGGALSEWRRTIAAPMPVKTTVNQDR